MRLKKFDDLYDAKTGNTDGWQIIYPKDGEERIMDAIENFGSYGSDKDLLEIMGLLTPEEEQHDRVVGYLTAKNVFERIKEHYRKNHDKTKRMEKR